MALLNSFSVPEEFPYRMKKKGYGRHSTCWWCAVLMLIVTGSDADYGLAAVF